MTAVEILSILLPFQEYLVRLHGLEVQRQPEYEWDHSLSLSDTCITLKIMRGTKDNARKDIYIEITFRIENNQIVFSELFHAEEIYTHQLTDEIRSNKKLYAIPFKVEQQQAISFSDEILNYLLIADRISMHAVNMNTGDSYWPGNYSKVKRTANSIVLEQVNHMNSRSLNHKENYSLRSLIFKIPLQNALPSKQSYDDILLGNMLVSFSDRSSQNNRAAGAAILEEIKTQQQNFLQ